MARAAPRVPEWNDLLCESCGYVLNGLPDDGRCPECGKPIGESVGAERAAPAWESNGRASGFWITTGRVIFHPTRFYRTLDVRGSLREARGFARWHCGIAAVLFSAAATGHAYWYAFYIYMLHFRPNETYAAVSGLFLLLTVFTYLGLLGITRLAARLTSLEATYRGLRLPVNIVLRGLYYHAAHYLPVAFLAASTVIGYQCLLRYRLDASSANAYLYVLSGLVVLSAMYLFNTYWIGMRNMMYANR